MDTRHTRIHAETRRFGTGLTRDDMALTYHDLLRTFSETQLTWLTARLGCESDTKACQASGISRNTMSHWADKPRLDRALRLARQDTVKLQHERLRRAAGKAVDALIQVAEHSKSDSARVRAADSILDRVGLEAGQDVTLHAGGESLADLLRSARDSLAQQQNDETDDPDAIYERYYGAGAGAG